ncbi:hypothetical protein [Anabaenopsis elenkinii]|uniref:Uncharacterized protein n=1 Tax=Anabaenopsis elenkinii CCIBt3563 TaxID=2779889 RepID=A0A7S6U6Y8_9CYAN|nr:hypothetical protein [Anabaenopsis elenkinii]QOV24148.1 hypothetical protein IM676_07840 [Anabaenopsis elenkinii CCIBt3563]
MVINLGNGYTDLTTEDKKLLSSATVSDIIGVTYGTYRYLGDGVSEVNLTQSDFTDTTLWQLVNPDIVTGVSRLIVDNRNVNQGDIVLVQYDAAEYGLYRYLGESATLDLTRQLYLDPTVWERLTASHGTDAVGKVTLETGQLVLDKSVIKTLTLQVINDVDVMTTGLTNINAGGAIALQEGGKLTVDKVTAGGNVRLQAAGNLTDNYTTDTPAVTTSGNNILLISGGVIASHTPDTPFRIDMTGEVRQLSAESTGNAYIRYLGEEALTVNQVNGSSDIKLEVPQTNLLLNTITAGGTVDLNIQGFILDNNKDAINISASAINIQSTTGFIGEHSNYLDVDVLNNGVVNVQSTGEEQGAIYLNSPYRNFRVGKVESNFDVGLRTTQSIIDTQEDTPDVIGRNITLDALGAIATADNFLEVNTNSLTEGKLIIASNSNAYVREISDDLYLERANVIGDADIRVLTGDLRVNEVTAGTLTLESSHGIFIPGSVTTQRDIKFISRSSRLPNYDNYLEVGLPDDLYLKDLQPDPFSLFLTGTITSLADNATLNLGFSDDVILRGNIDVRGENSNLNISTPGWVYVEGFLTAESQINILTTDRANSRGSSVYVHGTSRIRTTKAGSNITITGAKDVDILGSVVAGGEIGANGVTFAGNDSTIVVTAGEQLFLDTGLLASKSVTMNGGIAGSDDNGLGLLITPAGGAAAYGLSSNHSGGIITINSQGNMEVMGTLVAGGKLFQTFDDNGNLESQTIDWSGNYGAIKVNSLGQAFIGGNTVNKAGEPIQTGAYLFAHDLIEVNGGEHDSGTGTLIQAASELVTHAADSHIEVKSAQDVDIQGLLLPGGEVTTVRDRNGAYMGRYVSHFDGESTLRAIAGHQVRVGQTLQAGKQIDLIGGIDPIEPDPEDGSTNYSGRGMVVYGSSQILTWKPNSSINLHAAGRVDILAPGHGHEIAAADFYELATGVVSQDVTLRLQIDKVGFVVAADVTLLRSETENNREVADLVADLNAALVNATWTVVSSQGENAPEVNSIYTEFDQYDLWVKIREGRLVLTSSYAITLLSQGTINANLLGFSPLTSDVTSTLPYNIHAGEVGSQVTIGAPTGDNGKLYIAGKVLAHTAIHLNSGTSPDGVDIDLDGTGLLETVNGDINLNVGVYGVVKGDAIARGEENNINITASKTLELHGSLTAGNEINLIAGEEVVTGETSIHTFGTSRIDSKAVHIQGLNDVVIDSFIGDISYMEIINLQSLAGNLIIAPTSGRIVSYGQLTMGGENIINQGVVRSLGVDGDPNTIETLITTPGSITLDSDIISEGSLKVMAGESIHGYNSQIIIQTPGETLQLIQTNPTGAINLGRTVESNGIYQQQGIDLVSPSQIILQAAGEININSAARMLTSGNRSQIQVTGKTINIVGAILAGGSLTEEGDQTTWTGKGARIDLNATELVTFGGMGVTGGILTPRGGAAQATGDINITIAGGSGDLDLTMNSLSLIQTDPTARFSSTGTPRLNDSSATAINIQAQNRVETKGTIQAFHNGSDITINTGGLLLVDGYLVADDTLNLDGGTTPSGYGLIVNPVIFKDQQNRLVNSSNYFINQNGEYVDPAGEPVPLGDAPVEYDGELSQLTRISGGILDTAPGGTINMTSDSGIIFRGQVAPEVTSSIWGLPINSTVNPEKLFITSKNNAGDIFVDNQVRSLNLIHIQGKNIQLVDYQELNPKDAIRPNNALITTSGTGNQTLEPAVQIHATGEVLIARSKSPLERALVQSHHTIEIIADTLLIQGFVRNDNSPGDINIKVVTSAEINGIGTNGIVTAGNNLNITAGIDRQWSLDTLRGEISKSQLKGSQVLVYGTGSLNAPQGAVNILSGGPVTIAADATLATGQKLIGIPVLTQIPITKTINAGTKKVLATDDPNTPEDESKIAIEVVNWIPTTVTEQVGVDQVRVGSEFFTMNVTLNQDSYWNPETDSEKEYFVNQIDYFVDDLDWGVTGIPKTDAGFNELTTDQQDVVLEHLGYYRLFDFSFSNAKVDRNINGNPTRNDVYWNLIETSESYEMETAQGVTYRKEIIAGSDYKQVSQAGFYNAYDVATNPHNIATTIINIEVDGWNNIYLRVPTAISPDLQAILRTVSQNQSKLLNATNVNTFDGSNPIAYTPSYQWINQGAGVTATGEYVGYFWNEADAKYTQETSRYFFDNDGYPAAYTNQWDDWVPLGGYWMDNDDGSSMSYDEEEDVPTWGWRALTASDISVLNDVFGDGHDIEYYVDKNEFVHYPHNKYLSTANLNMWLEKYDEVQSTIIYTTRWGSGDDIGGFVRGRKKKEAINPQEDGPAHWSVNYVPETGTRYFNLDLRETVNFDVDPEWSVGDQSEPIQPAPYQLTRYTDLISANDNYINAIKYDTLTFTQQSTSTRAGQFGFEFEFPGNWVPLGGYWVDNDDGEAGISKYKNEEDVPTWDWRELTQSDKVVLNDAFGEGKGRETYTGHPFVNYPDVNLSTSTLNNWLGEYDQVESTIIWSFAFSSNGYDAKDKTGDDVGAFVRGRDYQPVEIKEDWLDYQYHWKSKYKPVFDSRLQTSWQWVSQQQNIYDGRPRYETWQTQVKDVSIKYENRYINVPITTEEIIWLTVRTTPETPKDYGEFYNSISAAKGITIEALGDVNIAGKLSTLNLDSNITITSDADVKIKGELPANRTAETTIAAPSILTAPNQVSITATNFDLTDISELRATGDTGTVMINTTNNISFAGVASAGTLGNVGGSVTLKAGNDIGIFGKITSNDSISAEAGGDISGNIATDIETASTGTISLSTETTGKIDLPSAWLQTGTFNAIAGTINNYLIDGEITLGGETYDYIQHGLIAADTINITTQGGITANLKAEDLNINNNGGKVDLTLDDNTPDTLSEVAITLTTNDTETEIKSAARLRLTDINTIGTGDIKISSVENITVEKLQIANQITIATAKDIILQHQPGDLSAITIQLTSEEFIPQNTNPIQANTLHVTTAQNDINLHTQVSNLSIQAGGVGDVNVTNVSSSLNLQDITINQGDFTLTTNGALIATLVEIINAPYAPTFTLTSNGDMTIGQINAGNYSQ